MAEHATTAPAAGGDPAPPVVDATGISKRFGATVALDGVDLRVEPGEVHALVGRNGAGKSTLVSILTGLEPADSGTVLFGGVPAPALGDRDAWRRTVACVYQKSTIIPHLSVTENLFVNRQTEGHRLINWRSLRRRAGELLGDWDLDVDVRRPARDLTVEQRQMVEVARALSFGARFIILDEPTARLDAAAIARLFDRIRALRAQGVTFLYISHHLQEIFDLCERVTVYRDARHIVTAPIDGISHNELVAAMTGEQVAEASDPRPPAPPRAEPVLAVDDLTVGISARNVSFDVAPGEIVGLAGAGGSGKFAVASVIVGLRRPDDGVVRIAGVVQRPGSVPRALAAGIGFVPQDRHREGLVPGLSVAENLTMTVPHRLGQHGLLSKRRQTRLARRTIEQLDIVTRHPAQQVVELSGGNQQKVVMGRALADQPRVLVLMSPTAGVDVKSKRTLMDAAAESASDGAGVLVVTDDLDDLRYCHRVVVMFRGEVVAEVRGTWDDETLVAAMEGVELSRD
jgi:simple sugar transport system ATP-binding protein